MQIKKKKFLLIVVVIAWVYGGRGMKRPPKNILSKYLPAVA